MRWQAQDEEGALLRDQLKQAAHLWEEKGRPDDLLWTGTSEREFELWRGRYPGALTAVEDDFTKAMVHRARRRKRMRRLAVTSVLTAAVVVAAVTAALWRRSDTARQRARPRCASVRRRRFSRWDVYASKDTPPPPSPTPWRAWSARTRSAARPFAVQALWKAPIAHVVTDAINPILPVWSPDGQWLALGGTAGFLLLDRDGGRRRLLETAHVPIGFTADGSRLSRSMTPPDSRLRRFRIWSDSTPGHRRLLAGMSLSSVGRS